MIGLKENSLDGKCGLANFTINGYLRMLRARRGRKTNYSVRAGFTAWLATKEAAPPVLGAPQHKNISLLLVALQSAAVEKIKNALAQARCCLDEKINKMGVTGQEIERIFRGGQATGGGRQGGRLFRNVNESVLDLYSYFYPRNELTHVRVLGGSK